MDTGTNSVNSTLSQRVNLLDSPINCDLYANQNDDGCDWEFPRDKYVCKLIKKNNIYLIFHIFLGSNWVN
jgi:hypothetical protein